MINAGLISLDLNTELVHLDKYGNIKPIFQENRLCIYLLKNGYLNPIWINKWYAPIIQPFLGFWSKSKNYRNLITNAGKAAVASRINGAGGEAVFDKIGQGVGTTAAAATDTALETEKAADGTTSTTHAISSATTSRVTTTVTNDTAQMVGTIAETATMAITESGVFNAANAGTMLARQVFSAINVVSGDSLQFTWKIKAA